MALQDVLDGLEVMRVADDLCHRATTSCIFLSAIDLDTASVPRVEALGSKDCVR